MLPFEVPWPAALREVEARHREACVAFGERDYPRARALHVEVLGACHDLDFLGGMGLSLCQLAMIDLAEGDVDGAWVRFERGIACYEEGGHTARAVEARALWERASAS